MNLSHHLFEDRAFSRYHIGFIPAHFLPLCLSLLFSARAATYETPSPNDNSLVTAHNLKRIILDILTGPAEYRM